jgi:2-C-methyl-D-erythritol 2,4-cyclodiphosphate synthase
MRIGLGTDLHRLVEGRPLMLGGVQVPFYKGSEGHSDGDVLAHAITDALLGALALRDIGYHFPDTDPAYKGADSMTLLQHVIQMVQTRGWQLVNIDATIHLQQPKLNPYIDQIRENLAKTLGLSPEEVSVKAKTGEGIGHIGQGEAVEAIAICLIRKTN